jgi:hypothetical protein
MERVGAHGHVTFGGRLEPDVAGFPARQMARTSSGDWRNPERIRAWASKLARAVRTAKPGVAVDHPARSLSRLLLHGLAGAAATAVILAAALRATSTGAAIALAAIVAVALFAVIARHYFGARGAREPLPTAAVFADLTGLLGLAAVAVLGPSAVATAGSLAAIAVAAVVAFVATWLTGGVMSTLPWPTPPAVTD